MFKPEFCCLFATHLRFLSPSLPPFVLFLELHLCWFRMGWSSTIMSLLGKKGAGHWYTIIIWVWKLYPNMNQIWMGRVMINPKVWGTPCSDKPVCLFALFFWVNHSLPINQPVGKRYTYIYIYAGWWLTYPSEKNEFVSWDDAIPNMMGKSSKYIYINVPNHQPGYISSGYLT